MARHDRFFSVIVPGGFARNHYRDSRCCYVHFRQVTLQRVVPQTRSADDGSQVCKEMRSDLVSCLASCSDSRYGRGRGSVWPLGACYSRLAASCGGSAWLLGIATARRNETWS